MRQHSSKSEFLALLFFLIAAALIVSNGFVARVRAQDNEPDVYVEIEPIGDVLDKILEEYYQEPDLRKLVEGALRGMMASLDEHSSYISEEDLKRLTEDTEGEFDGIGVVIRLEEDGHIIVFHPLPNSPAIDAGLRSFDRILAIDGKSTTGMTLSEAASLIKGRRGTFVHIKVERGYKKEDAEREVLEFDVKRDKIPLESIRESRVLDDGIGYIRLSEFNKHSAGELEERTKKLQAEGMTSLILDLRWNVGGLLNASKEVTDLFLPKNTLVVYTEGRDGGKRASSENMRLYTTRDPVLPPGFPIIILVNQQTASAAEIVTGALQFWSRALIVGETTYGKGSVQTIIQLQRPRNSALRLTTALYYTPAEVTIHNQGIKPDVEVPMDFEHQQALFQQMLESYEDDPSLSNQQNHGGVTGNEVTDETVEDTQLKRAAEILREDPVFENLIEKYHKDTRETQVAASETPEAETQKHTQKQ